MQEKKAMLSVSDLALMESDSSITPLDVEHVLSIYFATGDGNLRSACLSFFNSQIELSQDAIRQVLQKCNADEVLNALQFFNFCKQQTLVRSIESLLKQCFYVGDCELFANAIQVFLISEIEVSIYLDDLIIAMHQRPLCIALIQHFLQSSKCCVSNYNFINARITKEFNNKQT